MLTPQGAARFIGQFDGMSADMLNRYLALKARGQKISTLSLVPPMIDTAHPDIKLVRHKVSQALGRAISEIRAVMNGHAPSPGEH